MEDKSRRPLPFFPFLLYDSYRLSNPVWKEDDMSDGDWIIVRNWAEFQHPDVLRSEKTIPPWIRVYTKLLHNPDFESLTMFQRGVLTSIWLEFMASDGRVNLRRMTSEAARVPGQRLRRDTLDSLVRAGFITFAASMPPKQSRLHAASQEKKREEEKNPPTPLRGTSPNGRQRRIKPEEAPALIDAVSACQNFIEGHGWDDSFTEPMIIEEFGRIERARRTTGTIGSPELAGLLEQWKAERQNRYGVKANLA